MNLYNSLYNFSGHSPSFRFLVESQIFKVFSCLIEEQFGARMRSASELPGLHCTILSTGFTGKNQVIHCILALVLHKTCVISTMSKSKTSFFISPKSKYIISLMHSISNRSFFSHIKITSKVPIVWLLICAPPALFYLGFDSGDLLMKVYRQVAKCMSTTINKTEESIEYLNL